jgi:hypothetical protein
MLRIYFLQQWFNMSDPKAENSLDDNSGARSQSAGQAGQAAQAAGFAHAFNVADGFEGPVDGAGHRGVAAGWKASGLAWRQR